MDLLLRQSSRQRSQRCTSVAIPVVVDLLLRLLEVTGTAEALRSCRNPCCSGPTASTLYKAALQTEQQVAIPVVVDLLLRQESTGKEIVLEIRVAIPVVVDLLLRQTVENERKGRIQGRNPCCSGPTASTVYDFRGKVEGVGGRNPCCSGPTASTLSRRYLHVAGEKSQSLL